MSAQQEPWDDARLSAALTAAVANVPTPDGLFEATLDVVRPRAKVRPWWRRPLPVLGLTGAIVAAVTVVAIATWPIVSTPSAGRPVGVTDLARLEVPDLIARQAAPSSEEVVVHGWYGVAPVEVDCEVVVAPHPLVPDCAEWYQFLMAEPDDLQGRTEPAGPYVIPMLRRDAHVEILTDGAATVEVLAIGHLADRRTGTCPATEQADCAARFVIDRLLPFGATPDEVPEPWSSGAAPTHDAQAARAALEALVGPVGIVSIGSVDGAGLQAIEPILAGVDSYATDPWWVIRAFVDAEPIARAFILSDTSLDGTPIVSEITPTAVADVQPRPDASPETPPTTVLGLPVIDVPTAIDRRDASDNAWELAVRGWFAPTYPIPCPFTPTTSPVQPVCPDDQILLMAQPETLSTRGTNAAGTRTTGFRAPEGPALQIDLDDIDRSWSPKLDDLAPPEPVEIVALGHFADDRSALCSPETVGLCRDRFVVDRVAWADGREVPPSHVVDTTAAVSSVDDVLASVRAATGDLPVLAVTLIQGPDIRRAEPAHANHLDLIARDGIWVVRVLIDGVSHRFLVIDGSDAVYRVDGTDVTHVAGTPPPGLSVPHARPDSPTDFPIEVAGLPVIDVAAAIEVRAAPGDDRELAVRGWYYPNIRFGPLCSPDRPGAFVLGICTASIDGQLGSGATDTIDPILRVTLPPGIRPAEGVPVVFLGHFDDRRSSACGGDAIERRCADIFVVDSVWVDGGLRSPDWTWPSESPPVGPEATADYITRTFATIAGDEATVLSVGAISGSDLADLEPAVGAAMSGARWVWHATVLSGDRVRTFLIADDDAVARREGRSNEWWEVVGDQVTGTGADIN